MSSLRENYSRKDEDFCKPSKFRSPLSLECSSFLMFLALLSVLFFQKYMFLLNQLKATFSAQSVPSADLSNVQAGAGLPPQKEAAVPISPLSF
jgi:hypothetical protein